MAQTTRRSFLRGALALGLVPGLASVASADDQVLEAAAARLETRPMTFLVARDGEIRLAGFEDSVTRFEAYAVSADEVRDPDAFSWVVERVQAVRDFIQGFSWDDALGDFAMGDDNDTETCTAYLEDLSDGEALRLSRELEAWFAEPPSPDERYSPDIVRPLDGVGMAYALFAHGELWQAVDRLGLVEIDGASPGNDYRGMQLESSLVEANAAAAALGLPIRFEGDAR